MHSPLTMYPAHSSPADALLAHVGRRPHLYVSVLVHAVALVALYQLGSRRVELDAVERQRQLVESGSRLTDNVRLEKRVRDMAQVKSLLDEAAGDGAPKAAPPRDKDGEVQFAAAPATPADLLKQARELSRAIERIERESQADELARLLHIPKDQALKQVPEKSPPEQAWDAAPKTLAEAAAKIERLEARARDALERRREQLARQRDGAAVKGAGAGKAAGGGNAPSAAASASGLAEGGGNLRGGPEPTVLERMSAFVNPDLPDGATKAYLGGGLGEFYDHGTGRLADVDTATMVKGAGRIIGPGGTYANRIYVNRWYLIGPFDGQHGEAMFSNPRHPPEQAVALDAVYRGKGGRMLAWEYVDMARYPLVPAVQAEDAVYYGYTELMVDKERDLTVWVGADDDAQLWLNDKLVWRGGNVNKRWFFGRIYDRENTYARDYNLSEGGRVVHLKKGRNKLFFKLSNGPTRLFFSMVLTPT